LYLREIMQLLPKISLDFTGIVFMVFCAAVFIQLLYALLFFMRLSLHRKKNSSQNYPPLSVIICARNEEDHLFKHLPEVLNQNYPQFEVIVVNDQSIDDTKHIIQAYQKNHNNLKYIEIKKNKHSKFGKKMPLTIGIKGAKYEHLVLIDADCFPASKNWLKQIVSNYTAEKEIVIGYGPYTKEKGFLNRLIRFDTTMIGITYLSFAKNKIPYMAVGRNMSYLKSKFFEVDGFKKHYHIQSGDDDLFMKDAANRKNVSIEIHPDSFVYSLPKTNWKSWINQKKRHYSTAPNYRLINKLLLGIFPVSMFLMLTSFITLLFSFKWWWITGGLLLIRYLVYWLICGSLFKKLASRDLIVWFPFFELLHFIVMPFIYYSNNSRSPDKW